jgi:peptidyl-tRNA hydrolase
MLAAVRIVVGPGMPGRRFEGSRHNIGYGVVDRLAARRGTAVGQSTHGALLGSVSRIATGDWVLGDPTPDTLLRSGPRVTSPRWPSRSCSTKGPFEP